MTAIQPFKSEVDLKKFIATNYMAQIKNFFGDEKQAMKFLSSMMADVQKTPTLLECEPSSVINSYMTMAQLGLMPSGVSGEAYVLPYNKGQNLKVAQFQLGYQGIITLFYRAGGQSVRSEIVREHDDFSYENGVINHKIDIMKSNKARGDAVGAYAIGTVNNIEITKVMNKEDIMLMGSKFSKSFSTNFTPWKETNDPELWMWKKTVLKQLAKMLPKNETINKAFAEDNEDSIVSDLKKLRESGDMTMGGFLNDKNSNEKDNNQNQKDDSAGGAGGPGEGGAGGKGGK